MKRLVVRTGAIVATSALCFAAAVPAIGQTAATPPAPPPPSSVNGANAEMADEEIILSPFVVEAAEDEGGYSAKATLAGTRIRTELKDVGSAISVVTAQFLQDTGARNSQDLLVYTTSTEVGGAGGNFVGAGNGAIVDTRTQRAQPQNNTRVRGLTNADNTRDFFLTDIPWDSYIVGRVDLQRGPNSILFGIGSPAGIVNSSLNQASFKDANTAEVRFGSFESYRGSLDLNKVLMPGELAIRVSGLNDKTYYRQDPAFNHDKRAYAAFRFDPKALRVNGMSTSIRASYEKGAVDANRPRVTPPVDAISPWFDMSATGLKKRTYSALNMGQPTPAQAAADPTFGPVSTTLTTQAPNPNYAPWIDGGIGGQIFDQPVAIFADPGQTGVTNYIESTRQTQGAPDGIAFGWATLRGIQTYNTWAVKTNQPNQGLGVYKAFSLRDRGVFDFYKKLIDGPTKREEQDFEAFNVALAQTFLNNKVGLEAVYDHQNYSEEQNQLIPNPWITVDVINTLPDGRPNPNVGRAMVVGAPNANGGRSTKRDAFRFTGFGELNFADFMDRTSWATRILGRHVFTGLYMDQRNDQKNLSWYSYVTSRDYRTAFSESLDARRIPSISYLGGSLANVNLGSANIPNIAAEQIERSGTIRAYNTALAPGATAPYTINSLVGWQDINLRVLDGNTGGDRNSLYSNASKVRDDIKSTAFVWQGFFLDGVIVPTVGWRKDTAKNYNAGDVPSNSDTSKIVDSPTWTIPTGPADPRNGKNNVKFNEEVGKSTSWSVVVHSPKALKDRLPFNSDISLFYNRSDNFQPAGGRADVTGKPIQSPKGKTKDYGVTLSTLNDRLLLKVNWYETSVKDASLDGGGTGSLSNVYMVGYAEHWGRMFAQWAKLGVADYQGNTNYARTIASDPTSPLIDPAITQLAYQPAPGQSVAAAKAAQDLAINTFLDEKNSPPAEFESYWQIAHNQDWSKGWGGYISPQQPSTMAVTGDTKSKGVEYEVVGKITPNWNVSINAAKTQAQRINIAQSFATWVDARYKYYQGPAGDVRLWNGGFGGETVRSKFTNEFYGSYLLYRLQENGDVPELRPWRFNVVTNYSFPEGRLKGFNVGGGYRWQDKNIIGYRVVNGAYVLSDPYQGPTITTIDLWAGYERRISRKLHWRIQLNIRNAFGKDDLIPISSQPDGSMAAAQIPEATTWTVANTFKF